MISIGYFCQSLKLDPSVFSELKKTIFCYQHNNFALSQCRSIYLGIIFRCNVLVNVVRQFQVSGPQNCPMRELTQVMQ